VIETTAPSTVIQELPAADPEFRLEPHAPLPLVVPSAIEVFARDGVTELQWASVASERASDAARSALAEIVAASKREAARHPRSARARIDYGVALLNAGDIRAASAEFEAASALDPTNVSATAHLARARLLQNRVAEARALAEVVSRRDPAGVLGPLLAASAEMMDEHVTAAAAALTDATRRAPQDWFPRYLLGVLFIAQRRGREAAMHLRAAARNYPRSASIQHALGVAFGLEREWPKAARAFRHALTVAPRRRESVLALAHVLLRQEYADDAIAVLSKWTASVPSDREAHELIAQAHRSVANHRAARRHLQAALQAVPEGDESANDRARLLNNIGVCTATIGEFEEASQWYARSLRASPTPIAFRNLSRAYHQLGKLDQALRVVSAALTFTPDDVDTKILGSVIAAELGRVDEATAALNDLIITGGARADVYASLGWILSDEKRDYSAAMVVLQDGYERYPQDAVIANNLAYVSLMLGDLQRAKHILGAFPEHDVRASTYLTATMGLLRLMEGDFAAGVNLYKAAERLAAGAGRGRLAKTVRQKMHLELARAYLRKDEVAAANDHIKRGLAIQGRRSYREDLKRLWERVLAGGGGAASSHLLQ
jgi:tetratricopeptide (TPR) repeat protein